MDKPLWRLKIAIVDSADRRIITTQYVHAEHPLMAEAAALERVRKLGAKEVGQVVQVVEGHFNETRYVLAAGKLASLIEWAQRNRTKQLTGEDLLDRIESMFELDRERAGN